jgi:hypothetical protein
MMYRCIVYRCIVRMMYDVWYRVSVERVAFQKKLLQKILQRLLVILGLRPRANLAGGRRATSLPPRSTAIHHGIFQRVDVEDRTNYFVEAIH